MADNFTTDLQLKVFKHIGSLTSAGEQKKKKK